MDDLICQEYLNGLSAAKVASKLGLKSSSVYYILKKKGVQVRSNKTNSRRHTVDMDYFETIDCEEKAYWLGFIYADGCVGTYGPTRGEHVFKLDLSSKDKIHLEKLSAALGSSYPIHSYISGSGYSSGSSYSRLRIQSERFCEHLRAQGCSDRKTATLLPPTIKDKELRRHFIRGYVDGDGSIKIHKGTASGFVLGICGTQEILQWINKELPRQGAIQKSRNVWSTTSHSDNVLHLYRDCTIYLDRKYDRYLEIEQAKKPNEPLSTPPGS